MITDELHAILAGDATLTGLLSTYEGEPAIFTVDPAPGEATLPYIVAAGSPVTTPYDTKTTLGREIWRDIRCYAEANGSAVTVEAIAERVRQLLHRQELTSADYETIWSECDGPIVADDGEAYGRIVTLKITIQEI